MKAKMAKLCLLFILLCSLPVFYSCSDEADAFYLYEYWEVMFDPEPPISETSLSITGGTKLGIKGGVAPYTAEIADGQIATAYVDENNDIQISSIKLGSTSLMVNHKNRAKGRQRQTIFFSEFRGSKNHRNR